MKKVIFILAGFLLTRMCSAQAGVEVVLRQVEANNKTIQAGRKYWDAKRIDLTTGLTPQNPVVGYDYMIGSPAGAGNQRDFTVSQQIDFPTAYKRKKELSGSQVAQTRLQQEVQRQDILLDAKLLTLQVIYLNKKGAELQRRLLNTRRLVENFELKLDRGDAIILDVNKAKLQLLDLRNQVALNENERQQFLTRIIALNGGITIVLNDTIYPALPAIPDFEILDSTIEANDPVIKVYEEEKRIREHQLALQKAMNLPKIEAGYHSQGILGQSYRGFHAGISIPLWENRNRLKAIRASMDYAAANADAHRLGHKLENKEYYDQLDVRLGIIKEYRELLGSLNNTALLNKALDLGRITVIQYFYDESFYFNAYDKYLEAELEYQKAVARLYKFQL